MLTLHLQIKEPFLLDVLKEIFLQAGICLKDNENECDGILSTFPPANHTLPFIDLSSFPRPLRLLDLLSFINNFPYKQILTFAHFSLNVREKNLKNLKTNKIYRLTGKECQLLRFFYQNKGKEISKDQLLKEIWGYHPDTTTHTLETHIYRLRQKLEENSATSQILLNCKEGYLFNF